MLSDPTFMDAGSRWSRCARAHLKAHTTRVGCRGGEKQRKRRARKRLTFYGEEKPAAAAASAWLMLRWLWRMWKISWMLGT